jgi:hypothetical protein
LISMKPELLPTELVETVSTAAQISGKSARTFYNVLSLLKLPREVQKAAGACTLPVSQGYIFAAHLDCPDLLPILEEVAQRPVTNAALERMLTTAKKEGGNKTCFLRVHSPKHSRGEVDREHRKG